MYRRVLGLVGLLALVMVVGCKKKADSGKGPGPSGPTVVTAKTPQEAFDLYKKAAVERDVKTVVALMVPEEVDKTVMQLVSAGVMVAAAEGAGKKAEGADKEKQEKLLSLLARHGLSKDELAKGPKLDLSDPTKILTIQKDLEKFAKDLTAKVTDKPGLLAEVMNMEKKDDDASKKKEEEEKAAAATAVLKDVKEDGDKASGKVTYKKKNRQGKEEERTDDITFRKVDGNWRIEKGPSGL